MLLPRHILGVVGVWVELMAGGIGANAAPCLEVTLTGTQGGPPVFNGQAGAGTLVRYGDDANKCSDVMLQFDAGRGTLQQLSKLNVPVGKINAVFLTHIHSDHTDGLADLVQVRWHFGSAGPKVDLVCSADVEAKPGHVASCANLATHLGDSYIASGEIAQRLAENPKRLPGGPAELLNVSTFDGTAEGQEVWRSGDVVVSAVTSRHIAGHASYRVDTPAGSVVIGGDAGNDLPAPPRDSSTSASVETLAKDADVVVHSTIHPVMGPDKDSGFPPPVFYRQATASDLGAMSQRAGVKHLMLTHLIPPLGAKNQGPYKVPGGGLTQADYADAAKGAGFEGNIVVGTDLATLRLPAE
ncbi:metal-dependent hydrolase, beta-lactamase superfamily III [Hoeflea sp. IMCC20628]|nr:metal-dependent hydrolase, beta-lactamase superfamily III [Hoeflea sp. IMCC20628]